jgi:hypothetical protein
VTSSIASGIVVSGGPMAVAGHYPDTWPGKVTEAFLAPV